MRKVQELNSHDRPVWRKSFTTSCVDVTINTSSMFQLQQGSSESTAAAQLKMAPHLILHACSARLFEMGGSDLAFALAKRDKNLRVSSDQRPPISPARTTRRALRPTNSGYVRSFQSSGCRQRVDCQLRSSKERQPINRDFQSGLIPGVRCRQIELTQHGIGNNPSSSFTADPNTCTLHCEAPPSQHPRSGTCSSMVAKGVERAATTTLTCREREREAKTAEQEDPEKVGVNPTEKVRWSGRQWHSCQRPALRSQHRPFTVRQLGQNNFSVLAFHYLRSFVLPPVAKIPGLRVVWVTV